MCIVYDWAWRQKEVTDNSVMQTLLKSWKQNTIRVGYASSYAHWEFFKRFFVCVQEELNMQIAG